MGHAASSRLHSIRGLPRCRVILGRTVSGSSTALSDSGAGAMTSERELCKQPVSSWTWKPGYATWTSCGSTCRCSIRPCFFTLSPTGRRSNWRFASPTIAGSPKPRRKAAGGYAGLRCCRCSPSIEPSRRFAGRRITVPAACSRRGSNAAIAPRAIHTSSRFTMRRAASTFPSAFTTRRARSSLRSPRDPDWMEAWLPSAFSALVEHGVPDMFPKLKVGFIETGASWIPYLYADLVAKKLRRTFLPIDFKEDLFRRNRIYVACQTNDDLAYILKYGTEDSLMIGTDYSHADQSAEIQALDVIEQRGKKEEIPASVARKILDDNPRRFYGL